MGYIWLTSIRFDSKEKAERFLNEFKPTGQIKGITYIFHTFLQKDYVHVNIIPSYDDGGPAIRNGEPDTKEEKDLAYRFGTAMISGFSNLEHAEFDYVLMGIEANCGMDKKTLIDEYNKYIVEFAPLEDEIKLITSLIEHPAGFSTDYARVMIGIRSTDQLTIEVEWLEVNGTNYKSFRNSNHDDIVTAATFFCKKRRELIYGVEAEYSLSLIQRHSNGLILSENTYNEMRSRLKDDEFLAFKKTCASSKCYFTGWTYEFKG